MPSEGLSEAQRAADHAITLALVGLIILPMVLGPLALCQVRRSRRLGGERLTWVVGLAWFDILLGAAILALAALLIVGFVIAAINGSVY